MRKIAIAQPRDSFVGWQPESVIVEEDFKRDVAEGLNIGREGLRLWRGGWRATDFRTWWKGPP